MIRPSGTNSVKINNKNFFRGKASIGLMDKFTKTRTGMTVDILYTAITCCILFFIHKLTIERTLVNRYFFFIKTSFESKNKAYCKNNGRIKNHYYDNIIYY